MNSFLPVNLSMYNDYETGGHIFTARLGEHTAIVRLSPLETLTHEMVSKARDYVQRQEME